MQYPAAVMSSSEMVGLGFPKDYIKRMAHHKYSYKYIQRTGTGKNSKFLFDTEEFEKLRRRGILR